MGASGAGIMRYILVWIEDGRTLEGVDELPGMVEGEAGSPPSGRGSGKWWHSDKKVETGQWLADNPAGLTLRVGFAPGADTAGSVTRIAMWLPAEFALASLMTVDNIINQDVFRLFDAPAALALGGVDGRYWGMSRGLLASVFTGSFRTLLPRIEAA